MTYNQLGKLIELKKQGWAPVGVVGDGEGIGAPPVVRGPDGRLHKVAGDGQVVPLQEGEAWTGHSSSARPGSPGTPADTSTG